MNVLSGFGWAGRAGRSGVGAGDDAFVGEGGDDDAAADADDAAAAAAAAPPPPDEACGGGVGGECGYEVTTQ